ncbi:MAG: hypothetical protein ABIQ16_09370 [Polyangiaceae bacterium]
MAIKNAVIPLLSGGAVLLGFAAFTLLRSRRSLVSSLKNGASEEQAEGSVPLVDRLERVSEDAAMASELPEGDDSTPRPALSALFIGRATAALSPFQNDPNRRGVPH